MSLMLRPPVPADCDPVSAMSRTFYPERPEDPAVWLKALPGYWVAVDCAQDQVVGYACLRPDLPGWPDSGKFRLHLGVTPEQQGQGIGRLLYDRLMDDLQALGAHTARVRLRDTQPDAVEFFRRRGFAEFQRMLFLAQDLPALPARFLAHEVPDGVEITTLKAEIERRPDCFGAIHALQNACFADIPSGEVNSLPSFEQFTRSMQDPLLLNDCYFLARAGDDYLGLSYAARTADSQVLGHRFTGVLREHRGRGIARALKAAVTRYAIEHGFSRITTATLQVNRGMRTVNDALGFTTQYAEIRLQRTLEGSCHSAG